MINQGEETEMRIWSSRWLQLFNESRKTIGSLNQVKRVIFYWLVTSFEKGVIAVLILANFIFKPSLTLRVWFSENK